MYPLLQHRWSSSIISLLLRDVVCYYWWMPLLDTHIIAGSPESILLLWSLIWSSEESVMTSFTLYPFIHHLSIISTRLIKMNTPSHFHNNSSVSTFVYFKAFPAFGFSSSSETEGILVFFQNAHSSICTWMSHLTLSLWIGRVWMTPLKQSPSF